MSALRAAAVAILVTGCGYRPVHGAGRAERFPVVLAASSIPDAVASDEVVAGARDELARYGALAKGESFPRYEIEVLRVDESSEGIAATPNGDGTLLPTARATRVGVVARAWLVRSKDGPRERDTADMRASNVVATADDAKAATFRQVDAVRAAGRRVGKSLASRLLGLPSSSD